MSGARTTIHRFRHTYRCSSPSITSSTSSSSAISRFQFNPRSSLFSFLSHPKHTPVSTNPFHFHIHSSYFSSSPSSDPKQDFLGSDDDYPTGDFDFKPFTGWKKFIVNLRMLIAFPWERIEHGSVLKITLRGEISDQLKDESIFFKSKELSLPEICDNLVKAAYDPRISGLYLHIDLLDCGWAKVEEIRRHILNFRKSGKFVVAYVPSCREKEYYIACACEEIYAPDFYLFGLTVQTSFVRGVLDKLGIEPHVEKIGKYKSAGDQLTRRTMSEDDREMLTALLDNIYSNWLDKVSSARGKKREDIENFINEGVYQVDSLKENGFISSIKYNYEVIATLRKRLRVKSNKHLPIVYLRKYSRVRKWTVGIPGGKELIAIIRASGRIRRTENSSSIGSTSAGIIEEKFIEKIHRVRGKNNLGKLYEKIGFNKEIISKGRYAELLAADQRSMRPDEAELFAKSVQHVYKQFRDNAASSRKMTVEKMEEVAQGRVWTGKDAASHGLVDAIGGLSRAIAIAKLKANIPQDKQITLVELSKPTSSLPKVLRSLGTLVGVDETLKELQEDLTFSDGVQARMDGIMFQKLEGDPSTNPVLALIKDYLSSK